VQPLILDPGVDIQLYQCMLTAAVKEVLKKDVRLVRIKITLHSCASDTGLLADILDGKSIVKVYTLKKYDDDEDRHHRELAACAHALKHNQGLVQFSFGRHVIRTDKLITILHSLKTHPTLEKLNFQYMILKYDRVDNMSLLLAIVDMLQVNRVIQEIGLGHNSEVESLPIYKELIRPLLEANTTRARIRALAGAWGEVATGSDITEAETTF
jgi:hypothetical protein